MKGILKNLDTFGRKLSLVTAVIELVGLVAYLIYAVLYSYYDLATFAGLLVALYCSISYALFLPHVGILPLVATAAETFALGIFFLNSYPVWADRLNNISMYGSRGTLAPVILNIVLMLLVIVASIIVAFSKGGTAVEGSKKPVQIFSGVMAGVLVITCLVAHNSTLSTNVNEYVKDTSAIMGTLLGGIGGDSTSQTGVSDNKTPISSPTDFSIDENGNYSFVGVEEADYYMIYLCEPEATGEDDSFLFSSLQIENEGAKEYTGALSDEFDFAYGSYLAKVLAFPEISDQEHTRSIAATAEYEFSGGLSAPAVEYFWNRFNDTMYFQISNLATYGFEAFPDCVEITVSNSNDSTDSHVLTIDNVTSDNYMVETGELVKGNTYSITAVATSSSEFVTTPESAATTVVEELTISDANAISDGFAYNDNFSSGYWAFPRVCANFDLENGGEAGPAKGNYAFDFVFGATPTELSQGSAHSYVLECWFNDKSFAGVLELYSDGTLYLKEDGWGPVSPGSVEGVWQDNGDGTATLSYDPSTILEIK